MCGFLPALRFLGGSETAACLTDGGGCAGAVAPKLKSLVKR